MPNFKHRTRTWILYPLHASLMLGSILLFSTIHQMAKTVGTHMASRLLRSPECQLGLTLLVICHFAERLKLWEERENIIYLTFSNQRNYFRDFKLERISSNCFSHHLHTQRNGIENEKVISRSSIHKG